jgi:arylsulfatase A-like enzyme
MSKPNILYIHSHDTGRYIQPYGQPVPTPNLQALAIEGVLFRQCFCAGPTCSPSRAALVTGRYPHQNGMTGLAHLGFSLNDYSQHLLHTLRRTGYATALSGMQHIVDQTRVETIGYDQVVCKAEKPDVADAHLRAAEWLDNAPEQPFFLSVGFAETHRGFAEAEDAEDPRYTLPPLPLPDTPEVRRDMARFKASARILDEKMGTVFDALKRNGLWDNTLIICTTDHGIPFPRMKCTLTDAGLGVMLIMRGPDGFSGGKVIDALASHLDVFPTICDATGIEPPKWLEGVSLLPLVNGTCEKVRDEIFAEVNYHASYEPQRCVRTGRYKYIRFFDNRTAPVLPNCDGSPAKKVWLKHGWQQRNPTGEALYELVFDPAEQNNLAHSEFHAQIRDRMRQKLERWMHETDDPLLDGNVPAPPGAVICDVNATHMQNDALRTAAEWGCA